MMKFRPDRYHHDLAERRFLMLASVALYIIFGTAMVFSSEASFSILNGYFIVSAIMLANTGFSFLPGLGEKSTAFLFFLNAALVSIHTYGLMYFTQMDPTFTIAAAVITFAVMDAMIFVTVRMAAAMYSILLLLLLASLAIDAQMNQWVFVGAMLPALIWRYFTHTSQMRLQEGTMAKSDADQERTRMALVKSLVTMSNQIHHPIANIKIALSQIDSSLGKNSKIKPKIQPSINRIYKSVMKMNGILNGFKQFSRLNEREKYKDHNLASIMEPVLTQFKKDSFYRKFKISYKPSEEMYVRCQKGALVHVMSEIVFLMMENISEAGSGSIKIEDRNTGDWVEITVELSLDSSSRAESKTWGYIEYAHLSQLVGRQRGFLEFEPTENAIRVKIMIRNSNRQSMSQAA